jgi:hypothetical protein
MCYSGAGLMILSFVFLKSMIIFKLSLLTQEVISKTG